MQVFVTTDGARTSLGRWLYLHRFAWQMRWWRFETWADRVYCRAGVVLRLRNPAACRGCGRTDLDGYDPTGADTWCPACCPDHDFKSESMRSGKWCVRCGEPAPWDYDCD